MVPLHNFRYIATLQPDRPFSYKATVYSHGWPDLAPFKIDPKHLYIDYTFLINPSKVRTIRIFSETDLQINVAFGVNPDAETREVVLKTIQTMFRLDQKFDAFYAMVKEYDRFSWMAKIAAGRILRSANTWEDMVKMLCTTNCTWRLTEIMVQNLVSHLGKGRAGVKSFPSAKTVARCDEKYLRDTIKMGYRAPYLLQLARKISAQKIVLSRWNSWKASSQELYKEIRTIKGFGAYAAGNLMKLLGRYDYLGIDSWSRRKFAEKYLDGKSCKDEQIYTYYEKFKEWAGLIFWLDVTEYWYRENGLL